MPLPDNFQREVLDALRSKGINPVCHVCSTNAWSVADQAVTLIVSKLDGGIALPPPAIPSAALVCNNCGNVRLFALSVLGLWNPQEGDAK